jgi:quinolinate synthase
MTAEELHLKLKSIKSSTVLCNYSLEKCEQMVVTINEINRLKREKNAIILAHSYVSPEIVFGVADYSGDSYKLSKDAMNADCDTIVFAAVRFMGETAKILNPNKEVLIPGKLDGCSLADAVTGEQVQQLKKQHPEHTFMCYINTTAEVKAECDVCVTSSNVYDIIERHPATKIFFLPDLLMGQNVQAEMKRRGVQKEILLYDGACYVHEQYDPDLIEFFRIQNPGLEVVSHPECKPEVAERSDFVGSTGQMIDYIAKSKAERYLLLTECGLSARLKADYPHKEFIGSCSMCRYMKSNTLESILQTLQEPSESQRVLLSEPLRQRAQHCIDQMFIWAEPKEVKAAPCE